MILRYEQINPKVFTEAAEDMPDECRYDSKTTEQRI